MKFIAFLVVVILLMIAYAAFNSEAQTKCEETHSHDVCFQELNP